MFSLLMKVKKLRRMTPHEAVLKVASKVLDETRNTYMSLRIRFAPIVLDPFHFEGFTVAGRFLFDSMNKDRYIAFLRNEGLDAEIIRQADIVCAHQFDLLGSGMTDLGANLPWHVDFKSGYRWEPRYYKKIRTVDLFSRADVKVPWELSRFQHAFTLGKAYWLTGNEKYALEFQAQAEDWLRENPPAMSVNWTCAMDVAIRAVNWISAVYFFRDSPLLDNAFWNRLNASLYLHGQFIMNNLENTDEHTGNHYMSNLAGLIGLGLYFGEFVVTAPGKCRSGPKEWLDFGVREMEKEMFVQVHEDGASYEASTSYHRLVAELLLVSAIWCARNGIFFSARFMKRLEEMHDFMLSVMKPDGRTPMFGDADDGRYLITARYGSWERCDFRFLLAAAGEFFGREDFRQAGRSMCEDALWLTGPPSMVQLLDARNTDPAAFPHGGFYVMRNHKAYCLIRCGELSFHGHGAHSHNDQLSFELQVEGQDVIVDPGTYVYSADFHQRNLFRSTGMHSTIKVGRHEQNDFGEHELFLMREQTFAKCNAFTGEYFSGSHFGYTEKCGVIHRRDFYLRSGELEVVDRLELSGQESAAAVDYTACFVLPPGTLAVSMGGTWELQCGAVRLELILQGADEAGLQEAWVSPRYGVRESSLKLCVRGSGQGLRALFRWT